MFRLNIIRHHHYVHQRYLTFIWSTFSFESFFRWIYLKLDVSSEDFNLPQSALSLVYWTNQRSISFFSNNVLKDWSIFNKLDLQILIFNLISFLRFDIKLDSSYCCPLNWSVTGMTSSLACDSIMRFWWQWLTTKLLFSTTIKCCSTLLDIISCFRDNLTTFLYRASVGSSCLASWRKMRSPFPYRRLHSYLQQTWDHSFNHYSNVVGSYLWSDVSLSRTIITERILLQVASSSS